MMKEKAKNSHKLRYWLISLGITLVLLGGVVWYQFWMSTQVSKTLEWNAVWIGNIIGDAVGGIILLLTVHHFVKPPKKKQD